MVAQERHVMEDSVDSARVFVTSSTSIFEVSDTVSPFEQNISFEETRHTAQRRSESPSSVTHRVQVRDSAQHGEPNEESRPDGSPRGIRGDPTGQVDGDRTPKSPSATPRGAWHQPQQEQAHRIARDGDPVEQSQCPQKHRGSALCRSGHCTERQRNQGAAPEGCDDPHLQDQQARCLRSSGFREGSLLDLRGDQGGQTILHVGEDHMAGGSQCVLPTAGTPSTMAPESGCQDDQGLRADSHQDRVPHSGARAKGGVTQTRAQGDSSPQQRCEQRQCVLLDSGLGADPTSRRDHERAEGGDRRSEGQYEPSQGAEVTGVGRNLRQLRHDLSAPHLESPGPSLVSDSGSRTTDGTGPRVLSAAAARHLEQESHRIAPRIFQELVKQRKTLLLEVACGPESVLSQELQTQMGYPEAAVRCAHWNGHDLTTGEGVQLILHRIHTLKPKHVWISTDCGPFSPIQNLNQRTMSQRAELEAKRKEVLRQYVGAACVWHYAVQQGCHVSWEWSQKCYAWRLPLVQRLMKRYQPWFAVVNGCQVNLRDPKKGGLLHKGWKVMTTHQRMAQLLDLPCRCPKDRPIRFVKDI